MTKRIWSVLGVALLSACGEEAPPSGGSVGGADSIGELEPAPLEDAQVGRPQLTSAQRLAFGPGAVLLVADGRSDRIVAIETGDGGFDVVEAPDVIGNLRAQLAELFAEGARVHEIVVRDVAVAPASRRIYVAAERHHAGEVEAMVAWLDAEGAWQPLTGGDLLWAEIELTPDDTPGAWFSTLMWQDESVVAVTAEAPLSPPTLQVAEAPFEHGDFATPVEPRVYLPQSMQVLADLPALTGFGIRGALTSRAPEQGWLFTAMVGAPLARFEVDRLTGGAVQAETVLDLGSGQEARDVVYVRGELRAWAWITVRNSALDGIITGYRLEQELLYTADVDFEAPTVLDVSGVPQHPLVAVEPALNGAERIALRTPSEVVVLRDDALFLVEPEPGDGGRSR